MNIFTGIKVHSVTLYGENKSKYIAELIFIIDIDFEEKDIVFGNKYCFIVIEFEFQNPIKIKIKI